MVRKEWYVHHTNCPKCGSRNVEKTNKEVVCGNENEFSDDVNVAKCLECGWKGMLKNLVIDPELKKSVEEIQVKMRTIDKVNDLGKDDVFIAAEDMVAVFRTMCDKICLALEAEDVIAYTQNIFTEIIKTVISTDISHRINKEKAAKEQAEAEKQNNEEK